MKPYPSHSLDHPTIDRSRTYLNSRLDQIQSHGQRLAHEHIGIVTGLERLLQLLQLPSVEVGPGATTFAVARTPTITAIAVHARAARSTQGTARPTIALVGGRNQRARIVLLARRSTILTEQTRVAKVTGQSACISVVD